MDVIDQAHGNSYALYQGDCLEVIKGLPAESIDYSIFSPPFVDLFCYSASSRDFGNMKYDQFFVAFNALTKELKRVIKPGRSISVHCVDIPAMKERDGYIGLKDFPGDIIRAFQAAGFIYHSRTTIWKDPLIEATRTKALGLAHKQLVKDSIMCRSGLPDYLLTFRDPRENKVRISHPKGLTRYAGSDAVPEGNRSHNIWRAYASPVWMDIRQTEVISFREARDKKDEKHICPLQLDVIERAVTLWSNPGEVVLTTFAGVGSEVYGAVICGRKGIGIELEAKYFRQAIKNVESAVTKMDNKELAL